MRSSAATSRKERTSEILALAFVDWLDAAGALTMRRERVPPDTGGR